ncbi:interferon-induced GTP-binding protein Mx2 [Colletotrichum falcatum]|nr:interferon-induced GTP-binding protein Mx2 [Colletotrichum falcatum]
MIITTDLYGLTPNLGGLDEKDVLKGPYFYSDENTFSEDVLKIEKCGPNEDYLTIIDVPGIFGTATEGVTTNRDTELVKSMVRRYIKDNRTIILAVLPSNVDVATQETLTLAEEADPAGDRTLGILTKADLLKEKTAKFAIVNLVEGNRKPLKLGYHVVTNRGGDDLGEESDAATALRERETMFMEIPWNNLPEGRVGISALRERLEELLGEVTDRSFPELRTETRRKLARAEEKLKALGTPRQTEREQQQYLVGIASKFQTLVRAALVADYSAHSAFDRKELRLITAVVIATERFNTDFDNFSRTYAFESERQVAVAIPQGVVAPPSPVIPPPPHPPATPEEYELESEILQFDEFDDPDPSEFPELEKITVTDWVTESPKKGIMKWLEAVHQRSRGLELGSFGSKIPASIFRDQSERWETITKQYISKIITIIHRFVPVALEVVCTYTQVFQGVLSIILDDILANYEDSMNFAIFLVNAERQLPPYLLNHYFNHNHQRSCGARIRETLQPKARQEYRSNKSWSDYYIIMLDDVAEAVANKSNAAHAKEAIHDTLKAHYKVAQKRFIDNIFNLVVSSKLLSGPGSPLSLFSEQWPFDLVTEKLVLVAGESRQTRESRETLKKEIQHLETARKILQS